MAERFTFTRITLRDLPVPNQKTVLVHDDVSRGLKITISPSGLKSFRLIRKFKGRPLKITLGKFDPQIPETREISDGSEPLEMLGNRPALNIRMARKLATALNAQLDAGVNPYDAVRRSRTERTLGDLFECYAQYLGSEGKKALPRFRYIFERYLGELPNEPRKKHGKLRTKPQGAVNWKRRALSAIRYEDVKKLRFALSQSTGETTSNQVIALLRATYSFGKKQRLYDGDNPAVGVGKFRMQSRDRFLQAEELPRFFQALATESDDNIRDFFQLALYTGARRGNMLAMRWDQLSLDSASWRIPETKNGEPIIVPLVEEAVEILRRRLRTAQSVAWVFPGSGKSGHLSSVKQAWARIVKRAGIENLRIHDLRRSLGSWMASTGANMIATQRALGHKTIAASLVYQRLAQDPVRAAMQRATSELTRAAKATTKSEVLEIAKKAASGEG
jgi:integrase